MSDEQSLQQVIAEYLRDDGGTPLELTATQYSQVEALMATSNGTSSLADTVTAQNVILSNQISSSSTALSNQVAASAEASINATRQVGNMVAEGFAVTMAKLDQIDSNIAKLTEGVNLANQNVYAVAHDLADLRQSFYEYVEEDRKVQAVQQATSDSTNIRLELERRFGAHAKIRANTVGILRARDLGVVRTDTIITETEKNLLYASDYWLASALIALAHWIDGSTGKKKELARENAAKALNEAFRLDRQKTSLMFGLINIRAGKRDEAARWFGTYLSFQDPNKVDHTMTMLLNICSSGILVGTEANDLIVGRLADWIDEIDHSTAREDIISFWKIICSSECVKAPIKANRFAAIAACCPTVSNDMSAALAGAYLHGIMRNNIEKKLADRDILEEETWERIDEMLFTLTGSFAGEELPLRRDYEYQKLIIDLGGNIKLANHLRIIKNSVLSETKRFIDIMNHAAYDAELSGATATTSAMATRLEMPWIKEGYLACVNERVSLRPSAFPIAFDGFAAQTTDGADESRIVEEYGKYVRECERRELTEAAAKPLHLGLAIGGAAVALLSVIMFLAAHNLGMGLLTIPAIAVAIFGVSKILKARNAQQEISARASERLKNGVIALREVCREIREWIQDFESHQAEQASTEAYMDSIIKESVDAANYAASCR